MLRTLLQGLRAPVTEAAPLATLAADLDRAAQRRLGRSLAIREVDAGMTPGRQRRVREAPALLGGPLSLPPASEQDDP